MRNLRLSSRVLLIGACCSPLLAGCGAVAVPAVPVKPDVETRVIDSACDWVHPVTITQSEKQVLTPETKCQILALSTAYNKNCRALGAVPAGGVPATQ
jgi:hypothetical protein